jgi:LmbE family N-acetylglucosaminyl deacetylase
MREPLVVFATDGAPADAYFWQRFGSREAYAEIRRLEARAALESVGVRGCVFLADKLPEPVIDQTLYQNVYLAFEGLCDIAARFQPEAILTLAYEGGHPDHDSCSLLGGELGGQQKAPVWEAPLYHRSEDGTGVYQRFVQEQLEVLEYPVAGEELARKQRMLECYKSQFGSLPGFDPARERFRVQAKYDYGRPPHPGRLNYEVWQWSMTGAEVSEALSAFLTLERPFRRQAI